MKKKVLMLVVSLLAISSLMAAMAFSAALVTNSVTTNIVNTNSALVSISENLGMTEFAKISGGKMVLDFTKGFSKGGTLVPNATGFQPGSRYRFDNLFYLTNNTDKPIQIGLRFDSLQAGETKPNHPQGLHVITTSKNVEGFTGSYMNALVHFDGTKFTGGVKEGRYITLTAGETIGVNWEFNNTGDAITQSSNCTLQVHARDASTTPWIQ